MEEQKMQTLQSSTSIIKTDITMLVIEARGYAGMLFRQLAREDGDIVFTYNKFLEIFFQLYLSFKYNAQKTEKIERWKEKEKIYDNIFYERILQKHEVIPEILLKGFDIFLADIISSGIYNLSSTEFIEKKR